METIPAPVRCQDLYQQELSHAHPDVTPDIIIRNRAIPTLFKGKGYQPLPSNEGIYHGKSGCPKVQSKPRRVFGVGIVGITSTAPPHSKCQTFCKFDLNEVGKLEQGAPVE